MKLFVSPKLTLETGGGVHEVIRAHKEELTNLGVEFTDSEKTADLVIGHAISKTTRPLDVWHSHGFYPTSQPGWSNGFGMINRMLFQNMMTARRVVSVSELAAEIMRRDFHVNPIIIRNGVNFHSISPGGDKSGFILWPKLTVNPTCDPAPVQGLAKLRPDLNLATLIKLDGIKSLGRQSKDGFIKLLKTCSIYLGTTRENCSMGMMEAMTSGIPAVGYDWGGSRELLINGYGCKLVEPGDILGLSLAIDKVKNNWQEYSDNARDYALNSFGWEEPIKQIYDLYASLLTPETPNRVSVVITLHNYAQWVGQAINSAKNQTVKPHEIIIVDDASTDNPQIPEGVRYIQLPRNQGVARARNIGIEAAQGNIILSLDADDILEPTYIERGLPLFSNRRTGIVFGALALMDEHENMIGKRWFDAPYSWKEQTTGHNTIPTCSMFLKEAWLRAGGYRTYESPAEDAALWTRITSQGWFVSKVPDNKYVAKYRLHPNSLSQKNKYPDWVNNREWKKRSPANDNPVSIYDCPRVGFIMRYSINEEPAFIRTLDSIEGLKSVEWSVFATGNPPERLKRGYPYIQWDKTPTTPSKVTVASGEIITEQRWKDILKFMEFPT